MEMFILSLKTLVTMKETINRQGVTQPGPWQGLGSYLLPLLTHPPNPEKSFEVISYSLPLNPESAGTSVLSTGGLFTHAHDPVLQ